MEIGSKLPAVVVSTEMTDDVVVSVTFGLSNIPAPVTEIRYLFL